MRKSVVVGLLLLIAMLLFAGCGECEHQFGAWNVTSVATCTNGGIETQTCSDCGATQQRAVEAKGHNYSEWVVTKEATCTEKGTQSRSCNVCGDTTTINIDAKGHKEVLDPGKAATCTASGLSEGKHCTVCNTITVKQSKIEAAHTYGSPVMTKEATCADGGIYTYTCSACGNTKTQTTGKKSIHSYVNGKCKDCGKKDPTAPYGINETWNISGLMDFTITAANEHTHCSSYLTEYEGFSNEQVVMLTIKYKVLGSGSFELDLEDNITVLDAAGEKARLYSASNSSLIGCDHGREPEKSSDGITVSCKLPYALNNNSSSLKVKISFKDASGKSYTGNFDLPITAAPSQEEEKLEGCTITVANALPETVSYYSGNTKKSSCSVTEITFEVSGDDLYIYFTGRKTYDNRGSGQSDSCKIGWKLYDNENYVVASGTAYTLSLKTGEGFKKTKDTAYDCITRGGTYRLEIMGVN